MLIYRLLALIIVILLAVAAGCVKVNPDAVSQADPAAMSLSEITTAAVVDEQGQAMGVAREDFNADTPTIYLSARINNAPEDTLVTAAWLFFKDSNNQELNRPLYNDSITVKGTRYFSFGHRSPSGASWEPGQYVIKISVNGREYANARFKIKVPQKADIPAPTITFFKAEPEAITWGQAVVLSWSTTAATKVDLSAVGNVQAVGNKIVIPAVSQEYVLTATNSVGTTTKKVYVEVTSFNSDKPELVIVDFWASGDKAYYKIRNVGGTEAKESLTGLYVNGLAADQSRVEILASGQERVYAFPTLKWSYGTQRGYKIPVRVCADDYNRISEYDEINNCLVLDW
ncbi:MAG: CARDB domain-containing protein [Dehalococcoidia bacterium]|nr:CARDB domain-containing protein [Dehalococcoidia bacterium]